MRLLALVCCILPVLDFARADCPPLDVARYREYCNRRTSVLQEHLGTEYVVDLLQHVGGNNMTRLTLLEVPGANTLSTAYQFQGSNRVLEVETLTVRRAKEMLRKHKEFSILSAVKQKPRSTGSIISFTHNERRYFEVESSGRKDEIRIHFVHKRRTHSEVFPYRLADNQWHTVALSISRRFVQLYIDCNKVYERRIKRISQEFIYHKDLQIWLGQRNNRQAFFKGAIEYVKLVASPQGYLEQCPHANVACPTCSQFNELEDAVQDLQTTIQHLRQKLAAAEQRILKLEECECRRSCDVHGVIYKDGESWSADHCTTCMCQDGFEECEGPVCPPVSCNNPITRPDHCCPYCPNHPSLLRTIVGKGLTGPVGPGESCNYNGVRYEHGESRSTTQNCKTTHICKDGMMLYDPLQCPQLDCPESRQVQLDGRCCKECREPHELTEASRTSFGDGPCSDKPICHADSDCIDTVGGSRGLRHICDCKQGFLGNGVSCEDIDECRQERGGHYGHQCDSNTLCVNTPGSYRCDCLQGYTRVSAVICDDVDECAAGSHTCDDNADCSNSVGSYSCRCRNGYHGNGWQCQAICQEPCPEGQLCVAPGTCACPQGFMGLHCRQELDECELGMHKCHPNSVCVNIPGSYECSCRHGFYNVNSYRDNRHGKLCKDLNECQGWGGGHHCPVGTACQNTDGGYLCICLDSTTCKPDCEVSGVVHKSGSMWKPQPESCQTCECKSGVVTCSVPTCDCRNPSVDLRCCPHCHRSNQCVHQDGRRVYHHGDQWVYECQRCQCMNGDVECGTLSCPVLSCAEPLPLMPGQCCPRCHPDPCLADLSLEQEGGAPSRGYCHYEGRRYRGGDTWQVDTCTVCSCKSGNVCCAYEQNCSTSHSSTADGTETGEEDGDGRNRRMALGRRPFTDDNRDKHDDGG